MTHHASPRMRLRACALATLLAGIAAPFAHADDRPGPEAFFNHPRMSGARSCRPTARPSR